MRPRTLAALAAAVLLFGGVAVLTLGDGGGGSPVELTEQWRSDTARDVRANHHAVAAGRIDGKGVVYAPISGQSGSDGCALYALSAADGSALWRHPIPAANCTIHSVADPTLADYDDDGLPEVLAATTERTVTAYHPLTGEAEFRHDLDSYGYTRPIAADFLPGGGSEVVAVDVEGTVFVVRANGTTAWTRQLETKTWGQPAVADFDGDGAPELAVGLGGDGSLVVFERDGSVVWRRGEFVDGSITWMTTGDADGDGAEDAIVATSEGEVVAVDGRGEVRWSRDFGDFAAVHAFGDGDEDGAPEVYAVARDGRLRSIDAEDGDVEWTTTLTRADVQMMPPPSLGDVTGDGTPELVAPSHDGVVGVVDPADGSVLASYGRDVPLFTRATLSDTDGDGRVEVYVTYSNGRVIALEAA